VPELTSQTEGGYAPHLPPLPPTHSGSGGRQELALSPSFAACSRSCSRAWAPAQDSEELRELARYYRAAGTPAREARQATGHPVGAFEQAPAQARRTLVPAPPQTPQSQAALPIRSAAVCALYQTRAYYAAWRGASLLRDADRRFRTADPFASGFRRPMQMIRFWAPLKAAPMR